MKLFKFRRESKANDANRQANVGSSRPNAPASKGRANASLAARAMDEHGDMVLRLALSQVRTMPDAEDVFQDVFMRLMIANIDFTSSEHLKAWLIRATVNRCHDLQRARARKAARTEPLSDRHAETLADRQTAPPGFEPDIWHAVGALPDDQRVAVHLHYVEGYSTEEIARIAQCAPATIRTRLFRAREAMRRELDRERALAAKPHVKTASKRTEDPPAALAQNCNSEIRSHGKQQRQQSALALPTIVIPAPSERGPHGQ